jgi:hypothetical protein
LHLDGNGLGQLQFDLKTAVATLDLTEQQYCQVFRSFSNALSKATQEAARKATLWLHQKGKYITAKDDKSYIPMRPLVLGGDDITLLCHTQWAMDFARRFCAEFKSASTQHLQAIHDKYLKGSGIKDYLTASGGLLYHKSGHAFSHSHAIVEDLTDTAKTLTKQISETAGPAAIAFFRLSSTVTSDYETVRARFQDFEFKDDNGESQNIRLGIGAYLLEPHGKAIAQLEPLLKWHETANKATMSWGKWRQMAAHITLGDKLEADRIYQRAVQRYEEEHHKAPPWFETFNTLSGGRLTSTNDWYWQDEQGDWQTAITDLLIIENFMSKEKDK